MSLLIRALLLNAVEAALFLGISERKFHAMRGSEGFPAPVYLGARSVRFRAADLERYVSNLPESNRAEPAHLANPTARSKRAAKLATPAVQAKRRATLAAKRASPSTAA